MWFGCFPGRFRLLCILSSTGWPMSRMENVSSDTTMSEAKAIIAILVRRNSSTYFRRRVSL